MRIAPLTLVLAAFAAVAPLTAAVAAADAEARCQRDGGRYLGHDQCRMRDGTLTRLRDPADEQVAIQWSERVPQRSPQAWALAATSLLFFLNAEDSVTLAGLATTSASEQKARDILANSWNVTNHDQLLRQLTALRSAGHRAAFERLGVLVDAMSDLQYTAMQVALENDELQFGRLVLARQQHRALGGRGILAWDLVRYLQLCRWGYRANLLSNDEAWDLMLPAAARLKHEFASWDELQQNYLIGRRFWSPNDPRQGRMEGLLRAFLKTPGSPFVETPWDIQFDTAPLPLDEQAEAEPALLAWNPAQ